MCAGLLKKVSQEKVCVVLTRSGPIVHSHFSETEKEVKKNKNWDLFKKLHSYSFNITCTHLST